MGFVAVWFGSVGLGWVGTGGEGLVRVWRGYGIYHTPVIILFINVASLHIYCLIYSLT
jgi:hypothetical protein